MGSGGGTGKGGTTGKTNYHLEEKKNYAEEEYHTGAVAGGTAGLLCDVPAAGIGAKICGEAEEFEGDACVPGHDGGTDAEGHEDTGKPEGQPPSAEAAVRPQVGDVDDSATKEAGAEHRDVQRMQGAIRGDAAVDD